VGRTPADLAPDERLRQLLDLDERLQQRIRQAETDRSRRLADARANSERVRAAARAEAARAEQEEREADEAAHRDALSAIEAAHQAVLRTLTEVPEEEIDRLARRALDCTLDSPSAPATPGERWRDPGGAP
jgi:vacuolar-type H+-ATPase subunit H